MPVTRDKAKVTYSRDDSGWWKWTLGSIKSRRIYATLGVAKARFRVFENGDMAKEDTPYVDLRPECIPLAKRMQSKEA